MTPSSLSSSAAIFSIALLTAACSPTSAAVDSYDECVQAGYDVLATDPPQCVTPDGMRFTRDDDDMQSSSSERLQNDNVRVTSPSSGAEIRSPVRVSGEARGTWYFEASFPISIETDDGDVLAETSAQADGDWMTEDFVPFDETVEVDVDEETDAVVIIHKSNASGLPENDDQVRVPIVLLPAGDNGTSSSTGSAAAVQWDTYENDEIGFAMDYPDSMKIEGVTGGPEDDGVRFSVWGPTQEGGTELYDGIMVTVRTGRYDDTMNAYVSDAADDIRAVGTITEPVRTVTLAGRDALTFTADSLGTSTQYYIPLEGNTFLHVTTTNPDPTGKGYRRDVQRMIDSLAIQ